MGLQLKTPTLLVFSWALQIQRATRFTQLLGFPSSRASKPCTQTEMLCTFPTCATQRHQLGSRLSPGSRGAGPPAHPTMGLSTVPHLAIHHMKNSCNTLFALGVCSVKCSPGGPPESTSPIIQVRLWVKDKDL